MNVCSESLDQTSVMKADIALSLCAKERLSKFVVPREPRARRGITGRVTIMIQDSEREARQTEVAKVKQKEGYGQCRT